MKLTRSQLVTTLSNIKGASMMTLHTVTDPEMPKRGNPFVGRIKKHAKVNVTFGANYEAGVNRQLEREGNENAGTFVAEPLPWGEWLLVNKLITHKGETYVRATPNPQMKPEVSFTLDGKPIESETVKPYLKATAPSGRQTEVGIEREVKPRTYKLSSIVGVTTGGVHYEIVEG
jgi:hypothetical protein